MDDSKKITTEMLAETLAKRERNPDGDDLRWLAKAVETMQLGVTITDPDGRIVYTNPSDAVMHGYEVDELLGSDVRLFASPDTWKKMSAEQLKEMKRRIRESMNVRKDGTLFPVRLLSDVVMNSTGEPVAVVTTCEDITERKRVEESLRRAEEQFRSLFENSRDVVFTLSPDGAITSLNPAFENMTGWSCSDWIGEGFGSIVHPDDLSQALDLAGRILLGESSVQAELRILSGSGRYLTGEITGVPQMREGQVVGILGIARDITARKRAEEALRAAVVRAENEKARSESILAAIGEGISIQDREFRILYQNMILKDFGGDHPGEQCYRAYEGRDEVCEGCPVAMVFRDGKIHTIEKTSLIKGKVVNLEITASPLRDASGEIIAGIELLRDITERRHVEEKLQYMSTHDMLTGLYNRAFFDEEQERLGHGRKFPVSIVMADVDGLKEVNDTQGHAAGDELLKKTAQALKAAFRGEDVVARVGGDEFAALLPDTGEATAKEIMERVRAAVSELNRFSSPPFLSLSLGAATAETGEGLIAARRLADERMYRAKFTRRAGADEGSRDMAYKPAAAGPD